jgi:hypothetical protein
MRITLQTLSYAILLSAIAIPASAQTPAPATESIPASPSAKPVSADPQPAAPPDSQTVQQLLESASTGIKFDVRDLMEILRDHRHEGWVLAAYPDPKTAQPLIGAGVSLDLPARPHPQPDPLNPHGFLEPSSADLWQAAGLDPDRLHTILDQFQHRLAAWNKKGFRKRIKTIEPQITDDEATLLLRVSALQAIYNARGYCRCFDQLTPSQQMALSQLVYQMGVNLQEFNQFLDQINNYTQISNNAGGTESASSTQAPLLAAQGSMATDTEYWKTVQQSLVQSQWARLYRVRAVSVIAMLDPQYQDEPSTAERRIALLLHPAVVHQRRSRAVATRRVAAHTTPARHSHSSSASRRSKLHQRTKRGI